MRAQPVPWLTICCIRPLRRASSWVTTPMYSSGTSMATRSTGSFFLPSISRVKTSGLPTVSSKPSRRMISTRTASWSSPRPCTSQTSGLLGGDAFERLSDVELGHLRLLDRTVRPAPGDLLPLADPPLQDSQEGKPADVRRGIEVGHERLERMPRVVRRRRNGCQKRLDERTEIGGEVVGLETRSTLTGVRVHDRELDLRLVGVEVEEELVHFVHDLSCTCVRPVDLVHDEDDREPRLERLAEHEPRLRQRPLARVDE